MKTLYLLRHAHTLHAAPPGLSDHERMLSPRGLVEARKIGMFMLEHGMNPDFVLTSSAVRTIQTAQMILDTLFHETDCTVTNRSERGLYQASAREILNEIQKTDDNIDRLMLVGHNPSVSELAEALDKTGNPLQFENFAPGTLAVFKAKYRNWKDFSPDSAFVEMFFAP
ncbi:MAG: histidine phosphatase family protein [Alphaproteobacteria bacterium]|nr:histidine phosphatase family protein [Alphaproteobacteria bacterium]